MERECDVTVIVDGIRHTHRVSAKSTYAAALAFDAHACCYPAFGLPRGEPGTVYEVQIIGGRLYRVEYSLVWAWANAKAAADRARLERGRP